MLPARIFRKNVAIRSTMGRYRTISSTVSGRSFIRPSSSSSKGAELVMRALGQAVNVRRRTDPRFVADGVIHHSDAGSQYTSLAFSQKLVDHGVNGSIGRVGTAYDNALMESTIGLFKSELIYARQAGWVTRQEVETATMRWVTWFNRRRLHSALDYVSPLDFEMAYTQRQVLLRQAA